METYRSSAASGGHVMRRLTAMGLLITLGIVFGDIGTSPLYVMKAIMCVDGGSVGADYVIGAVSCVIWTLTLQTTLKYVIIALRADNKGEGGILALYSLLKSLPHKWLYVVAAVGAAALVADGVITPAMTVTSAVEGLRTFSPEVPVVPIVMVIIIGIFVMQQGGTSKIGRMFGPFMLVWFLMLGILGCCNIGASHEIWRAFNPWYAVRLLVDYPGWFLILGAVFLCTTGAEALYSDLGHCGRMNISVAWIFVKVMLILNYMGQGAWIIAHLDSGVDWSTVNPFYAVMPGWFVGIGVVVSTGAAIIASQALLSGSFTIFSEAISLDFWPRQKIKYPSTLKGQLYLPAVNWALLTGCLLTVLLFRDSNHMEAAYGLAITVTMLMTTVLLAFYLRLKGVSRWVCGIFVMFFGLLEGAFFVANLFKFTHGGWFTVLIGGLVAAMMVVWRNSTRLRGTFIQYKRLADYAGLITSVKHDAAIPMTACNLVYFTHSPTVDMLESKLIYSIINKKPKRADHYWIIHVEYLDEPDRLDYDVNIVVPQTIYFITMRIGFRVAPRVSVYLRQVVEDLVAAGEVDLTSSYPSLAAENVAGDFRFVLIHRVFSAASIISRGKARLLRMHELLRRMKISDQDAMGLDTSNVTMETVPLILNSTPSRRITRRCQ